MNVAVNVPEAGANVTVTAVLVELTVVGVAPLTVYPVGARIV